MKRALYCFITVTILAFSILLPIPHFFARGECEAVLTINGKDFLISPKIAEVARMRANGHIYDFVKEKLDYGFDGDDILNYLSTDLGKAFYHTLHSMEIPPTNATVKINKDEHKLEYIAGKSGWTFDKKVACLALASALDGTNSSIHYEKTPPEITVDTLKNHTKLMASFSTDLGYSSDERIYNIRLASSFINGIVIPFGTDFSFNEVVGERTEERGFKESTVIIDGAYTLGTGGGVCQLSTTLYNAILLSGLSTKRVSRHSYPAKYVEPSRDAMVSAYSDFVFTNSTNYDLYIFAFIRDNFITVNVYGDKQGEFSLKSVVTAKTPFQNTDENGNLLFDTEGYILISKGIEGTASELYLVDQNGNERLIRSDTYKSKNAIFKKL